MEMGRDEIGWWRVVIWKNRKEGNSLLALEVLHDVQESVVHVRSVLELHLDGVEVAERIGDVERSLWTGRGFVALGIHEGGGKPGRLGWSGAGRSVRSAGVLGRLWRGWTRGGRRESGGRMLCEIGVLSVVTGECRIGRCVLSG